MGFKCKQCGGPMARPHVWCPACKAAARAQLEAVDKSREPVDNSVDNYCNSVDNSVDKSVDNRCKAGVAGMGPPCG